MDISRAIILSKSDGNSFNWRLAEWTYLLKQWQYSPMLGFGLGTSTFVSHSKLLPHNDYIRALIEGGAIGIFTFITFLAAQIVRLVQLIRSTTNNSQRQLCENLLAISVALPVGMITENIWSHTTFFFYWSALMAIAGWDNWHESKDLEDSPS
jgi:O-antigen ligase